MGRGGVADDGRAPKPLKLIELGPGRGTLMADFLRAAKQVPAFAEALEVHLVETSPALRVVQREALSGHVPTWHAHIEEVPPGPALILGNEFVDALPVEQLVRTADGWRVRCVTWDEAAQRLDFTLGPPADETLLVPALRDAAEGTVAEVCPAARGLAAHLGQRVATQGGAALLIDYGPARSTAGDTLQAVKAHRYHPALEAPGTADLTAHVDFQALAEAATAAGAKGPRAAHARHLAQAAGHRGPRADLAADRAAGPGQGHRDRAASPDRRGSHGGAVQGPRPHPPPPRRPCLASSRRRKRGREGRGSATSPAPAFLSTRQGPGARGAGPPRKTSPLMLRSKC